MKRMAHSKHWLGIGALLLMAAGFAWLGRWQLERAASNRELAERFAAAAALPALERPVSAREAETLRYRRITLRGVFPAGPQILLDNMTYQGRAGYQVLTPLRVAEGGLVLVNRGWLPASPDRRQLPDVALAGGAVEITGRIGRLPRAALELGSAPPAGDHAVAVLSFPDFSDLEAVLAAELLRFVVLLDPNAEFGFVRDWAPSAERAERNIAYAVQWFGLAALAIALASGILLRRYGRRREQS
jgi:surfeit locus 1 family protein